MSFVETQFPTDISYGATGGPIFLTDVVATVSGHEQRNSKWSQSRAKYNVASGIKTEAQWQALIAFFRARRGMAIGFRFKDWSDYKAENQPLKSLGGNEYQLVKQYVSGAAVYERDITKPVTGTVKLYEDSILQASGWSIDTATGIITTSLSGTLTADFEFDVPVRFDTDEMSISMDSFDAGNWGSIPLIEVRV
ncbi:MAG: glycoside hydrolase family 24 [Rickettsiales bacterium]|nr:glycoside hydrolase family 24 [Rickettsiales bacterium]